MNEQEKQLLNESKQLIKSGRGYKENLRYGGMYYEASVKDRNFKSHGLTIETYINGEIKQIKVFKLDGKRNRYYQVTNLDEAFDALEDAKAILGTSNEIKILARKNISLEELNK